jgi:hypothetical protein
MLPGWNYDLEVIYWLQILTCEKNIVSKYAKRKEKKVFGAYFFILSAIKVVLIVTRRQVKFFACNCLLYVCMYVKKEEMNV